MTPLLAVALALAGERRVAVVVGVNRGDAEDTPLRYAESDAARVADLLQSLGAVVPGDLVELQGSDAAELRAALSGLATRLGSPANPDERTLLFVYYSGHADGERLHLEGTELPLRELRDLVAGAPADLRVLVVDACRAGELVRMKGGTPVPAFTIVVPEVAESEGFAVITASAEGEDAQESERLQGGVFTHHLLAGLAGAADASGDHRVTLDEVYRYAYARTLSTTSRAPVVQHPSYAFDIQGQADVALTLLDGARRTGQLGLADAGVYVVFDPGETRLVAEVEVTAGGVLALPAGEYVVRRRLPDRVYEGRVAIRTGERTSLATTDMRAQPYGQVARRGDTTRRHVALAVVAGGGVQGPLVEGLGTAPAGALGLRADLPWFTLQARARHSRDASENAFLGMRQVAWTGDVAALRMGDLGRLSVGLGVSGGADVIRQRFETTGEAPDRVAVAGHVGPVGRVEVSVVPRLTMGVEAAWDIHLLPGEDSGLDSVPVPRVGADVTVWVR